MSLRKLIPALLLMVIFTRCTVIYYESPQPLGAKSLKEFPEPYRGSFYVEDDTIIIRANGYTYPETYRRFYPVASLDTLKGVVVKGDLIYDSSIPGKSGFEFTTVNDTIQFEAKLYFTRYVSDSLVLKISGDYLVVNEWADKKPYWNAHLLNLTKTGDIELQIVGNFRPPENPDKENYDGDLEKFLKITKFKSLDEDTYVINPSKKEFTKLIESGFYRKGESSFKRIR